MVTNSFLALSQWWGWEHQRAETCQPCATSSQTSYPSPITGVGNVQLLVPAPLPLMFPLRWAWSRLKPEEAAEHLYLLLKGTQSGRGGHKHIWLEISGSLLFSVCMWEHLQRGWQSPARAQGCTDVPRDSNRLWASTPGSCVGTRKVVRSRKTMTTS